MSELTELREQVRQRAKCACEFCGVTESSVGGRLTLDHFHPQSKGGADTLTNLIYCCVRCNQYKQNYWPSAPEDPAIWNPIAEPASDHFFEVENGELFPLTDTGSFTIKKLRLNRLPLVTYRRNRRQQADELRQLEYYKGLVQLMEQTNQQLLIQIEEQQQLLKEQRTLIKALLRQQN